MIYSPSRWRNRYSGAVSRLILLSLLEDAPRFGELIEYVPPLTL